MPVPRRPITDRFWPKVDTSGSCWLWTGATNHWGYGKLGTPGKHGGWLLAHRLSWELHRGPIPEDARVLHRCDTPACVNPAHLFLGTVADNNGDMAAKGRARSSDHRGAGNPNARLTEADVLELRRRYAAGVPKHVLAEQFGVSWRRVHVIVIRQQWAHL